jgi:hypothetical protein
VKSIPATITESVNDLLIFWHRGPSAGLFGPGAVQFSSDDELYPQSWRLSLLRGAKGVQDGRDPHVLHGARDYERIMFGAAE